jgi:hypothetical protein
MGAVVGSLRKVRSADLPAVERVGSESVVATAVVVSGIVQQCNNDGTSMAAKMMNRKGRGQQ